MAEDASTPVSAPKLTPQQEIKEKLRQARLNYNQAKKLIADVEKSHSEFVKIRDTLKDKENGVEANKTWIAKQRSDITDILKDANIKLGELETTATTVSESVKDIDTKYAKFKPLSDQVFDKQDGLDAVLKATRKLKKTTGDLAARIESNASTANTKLLSITKTTEEVEKAYDDFIEKKNRIDDEENGFEAQLRKATEYATSAQDAKTKSESALLSVTKFKDQSDELVGQIKDSKTAVDNYQQESEDLTKDIRNTLNKVTQFTLSKALQDRTKSFNYQMWFWAVLQLAAIGALTYAVYLIFKVLFIGSTGHPAINGEVNKPDLLSVISKFLFTTPLIFAVYITTSNYRHVRDLRDRYAWKETVAKNFQNYIKLVQDEFKDTKYEEERFRFSMDTVRSIYTEPNPMPKKRKYNFSLKTVQVNIEEEDLQELKEALSYNITKEVAKQEESIEEAFKDTITETVQATVKKDDTTQVTPKKQPSQTKIIPPKA